jgi:hypothetical protein
MNWFSGPARIADGGEAWEFENGDQLLVCVYVQNRHNPGVYTAEYSVVMVDCDEDHFDLRCNDESWGWSWEDVEWFIPMRNISAPDYEGA